MSNILFNDKLTNCVLIDFQLCVYRPIAFDLLTAIHLTVRRDERMKYMDLYQIDYYNYLTTALQHYKIDISELLSLNDLKRSFDAFKLIPLCQNIVYHPLTMLPQGTLNYLEHNEPETYNQICNINRNQFILDQMKIDKYYEELILEITDELLEFLFGQ